jgi:hypothetical protein
VRVQADQDPLLKAKEGVLSESNGGIELLSRTEGGMGMTTKGPEVNK